MKESGTNRRRETFLYALCVSIRFAMAHGFFGDFQEEEFFEF